MTSELFASAPMIFQGESNECGLACLCMVLRHYGHGADLQTLRASWPSGRALTLEQLTSLGAEHGLLTRALRCELEDLNKVRLPAVVHVDFRHYVVLLKVQRNSVTILDPASGNMTLSMQAFGERFTGIVVEMLPGPDFAQSQPVIRSAMNYLASIPRHNLGSSLWGLLIFSLLIQGFALVSPFYVQLMVDEVLAMNNADLATIVIGGFALIHLLSAIVQWLQGLLAIRLGSQLSFIMSSGLLARTLSLPARYFARRNIGDVISRFGSLAPLQQFVSDSVVRIGLDLLMVITTFLMMVSYSNRIAFFVLLVTAMFLVLQWLMLLPFRRYSHEHLIADAHVQTHFIESISSIRTIKRFASEAVRASAWNNLLSRAINSEVHAEHWGLGINISRYLHTGVMSIGIVFLASEDINSGLLTLGMLYTLMAYGNHFTNALQSLGGHWQAYLMLSLHVGRLSDIAEHPTENRTPIVMHEPVSRIEIQEMDFHYGDNEPPLFQRADLVVTTGEKIAITGTSGAGKSTLFSLLTGDEQPISGTIRFNHRPLSPIISPLPLFSVLRQEDNLLDATVTENITFMAPQPDMDRVVRAAALACIHEEILKLPLAYDEQVSPQGAALSAGQQQRLLIARTLYRQADIVLLDEATSHLDDKTAKNVMRNILDLPGICLFVTHSTDIAAMADRQVYLQNGQFIDR